MENSSSIARHQMEEVLSSSKSKAAQAAAAGATERKPRPKPEQKVDCPRCKSGNTKFCYYNNYSMSQPRYFCKACRRYWTHGGSLRNVPIGGGCRKTKRSSSSSTTTASDVHSKLLVPPAAEPMMPPTTCMDFPNVLPTFISAGFELPRDQHHLSLAAFVSSSSSLSNPAVAAPVGGTSFLDVLRGGAGLLDSGHRQTQNSGYYGGNGMGMPLPPPSTFGVAGPVQHGGLAIGGIAGATPAQGMLLNGTMMGAGEEGSGGGAKTMMGLQWQPQLGGGGSAAAQQGTSNNVMMDNSNNGGGGDGGGPSRDCYWINNGGPNPWQSLINSSSLM